MLRILRLDDKEEFLQLLNTFRPVNLEMTDEEFKTMWSYVNKTTITYVYIIDENIGGTISVIRERKFINNGALYAHIEDVVVHPHERGMGIATKMVNEIIDGCKLDDVYKITLNCSTELEPLYKKCGFTNNGYQMIIKTK